MQLLDCLYLLLFLSISVVWEVVNIHFVIRRGEKDQVRTGRKPNDILPWAASENWTEILPDERLQNECSWAWLGSSSPCHTYATWGHCKAAQLEFPFLRVDPCLHAWCLLSVLWWLTARDSNGWAKEREEKYQTVAVTLILFYGLVKASCSKVLSAPCNDCTSSLVWNRITES